MDSNKPRIQILIGLAAAAGAVGAAAMVSTATAPTARADDFTDIITYVDADFADAHKDPVNWDPSTVDVVLTWGRGGWRSLSVRRLAKERMAPVCSPGFADMPSIGRHPSIVCRRARVVSSQRVWFA